MANTIFKWAGSKDPNHYQQYEPFALAYERARAGEYKDYIEPMLGLGQMAAWFAQANPQMTIVASDINEDVIKTHIAIRYIPRFVSEALASLKTDEASYYEIRAWDDETLDAPMQAARFVYLTKLGWQGLYRRNGNGGHNVPYGRYKNPTLPSESDLVAWSEVIRHWNLSVGDYRDIVMLPRSLWFFDPPYDGSTHLYGAGFFNQITLANFANWQRSRGHDVIITNYDTPFVRKLYRDWTFTPTRLLKRMAAGKRKSAGMQEVVISHLAS